jgi:hypothetical protein
MPGMYGFEKTVNGILNLILKHVERKQAPVNTPDTGKTIGAIFQGIP